MPRNKRSQPEIDARSMADIAFLLLVFWLSITTVLTVQGLPQKLEKEKGFHESKKDDKGNTINFFRSGKTKQWKNNLDLKTKNMIEEVCQKEMKELGYI